MFQHVYIGSLWLAVMRPGLGFGFHSCAVVLRSSSGSWESTCFLDAAMATWRSRFLYQEFVLADLDTWTDEATMKMRHDKLGGSHDFCVACGRWKDDDHIHKNKNHPKWLAEWRKADF